MKNRISTRGQRVETKFDFQLRGVLFKLLNNNILSFEGH
jgi:hypothetical protein